MDIVMMDTQPIASGFDQSFRGSATAAQDIEFLRQEMAASHSKWRIVVGHHTIYSSGMHGRMNDPLRANMRALLPLLESRTQGADLYVCGHDHDLELIGDRTGHARPLFLISGAGSGVDVMKPRAANEPPTVFPQRLQAFLGFVVLDINPQTLTITFFDRQGNPRGMPLTMIPRSR